MLTFVIHNGLRLIFPRMILVFWKAYDCIAQHCVRIWPDMAFRDPDGCEKIRAFLKTQLFSVNNSYKCPSKQIHCESFSFLDHINAHSFHTLDS